MSLVVHTSHRGSLRGHSGLSPLSRVHGALTGRAGLQGHNSERARVLSNPGSYSCAGFLSPDVAFITTVTFVWKVSAITVVSCLPLYVLKYLRRKLSPPSYSKLTS